MKKLQNFKITAPIPKIFLMMVLPVLTLMCTEFYTHVPWDLTVPIFLLNLVFYYLLFGICTFLFGSTGRGYAAAPVLPMLFGLMNYYVVDFRSSPIVPWDIFSIGTAVSVASNYEFEIKARVVCVVLGFLAIILIGSRLGGKRKTIRLKPRLLGIILSVIGMFGYVQNIGTDASVKAFGLDTTLFTPNVLYRNNGLMGGFLGNLKYLKVEKPDGYSVDAVQEETKRYEKGTAEVKKEELPNVIAIMNEALSDPAVFGEFETSEEYFPFIHSLTENTVKGNCYVSVKGGNTANSEYEFLTGDSMAFMPVGSVPYQQYVKGEMPTLSSYLKGLGYKTVGIHPYNASGWARDKVYPWFGFDEALFRRDFEDPFYIRDYVSDASAFAKIIELYEEKEDSERLFAFEVTMQNHGGYSKESPGFEPSVHLPQLENKTTSVIAAEKYLTLMKKSDEAFESLVSYFEEQEEKTIILMFGDHQPSDYITNTFLKLTGREREGVDADNVYFDNYIVPFVIWANYEIEEEEIEAISVNYLSGLLLEKAGIPTTPYQDFLSEMRKEIPAVTANMIVTADGERLRYNEGASTELDWLNRYQILTYNHLADSKNRVENYFN